MNLINPSNQIFPYFENIIKNVKNTPVIFELGCCDGSDTHDMVIILNKYFKDYKYYAFEPNPILSDTFYSVTKGLNNIVFSNKAIGKQDGEMTLFQSQGKYYGSSSIRKPKYVKHGWPDMEFKEIVVPVCKLDSFCKQQNVDHIDFIYADIQGAQEDLIVGGENILNNTDYIYIEICDAELYEGEINLNALLDLLPNWKLVKDFGGDVLIENNHKGN